MDNIIKIICDGLNGIAWKDDAQVVEVSAAKTYAEFPSVTVYHRGAFMIDPIFSKRLQNWSRCIRARRKSLPSPTAQVLNELRLKYGPPAIEEYRNEPPISSADMADAEKLSAAYGDPG